MRIILIIKVVCSLQTQTALSTEIGMSPSNIYHSPPFFISSSRTDDIFSICRNE